jgi:hypothetical protein
MANQEIDILTEFGAKIYEANGNIKPRVDSLLKRIKNEVNIDRLTEDEINEILAALIIVSRDESQPLRRVEKKVAINA